MPRDLDLGDGTGWWRPKFEDHLVRNPNGQKGWAPDYASQDPRANVYANNKRPEDKVMDGMARRDFLNDLFRIADPKKYEAMVQNAGMLPS